MLAVVAALVATHWSTLLSFSAPAPAQAAQTAAASLAAIGSNWGLTPIILAITLLTTLGGVALYLSTDRQ